MVLKQLGVAAGVATSLFCAAPARAEEPPLSLEWTAPEDCPGRADVLARVLATLGSKDGRVENTRATVRGVVTRSGNELLLRLETRVTRAPRSGGGASSDVLSGTRQLAGATCDEVTAAGVLVIALAIDPDAAAKTAAAAPVADAAGAAEPSPAEPRPPEPAAPPAGGQPAPAGEPRVPSGGEPSHTHVLATGTALLDVGTLPGPAFGFRVGAGLSRSRVRVELGASYLLPRFAPAGGASNTAGANVSLLAGNVRGYYTFVPARVGVEGCLATEIGALIAKGEGFAQSATDTSPWLAVEPSTGLTFAIARDLSLGASVGALIPFGRSTVRFATGNEDARTYKELHTPAVVSFRLGLSLSYLFR